MRQPIQFNWRRHWKTKVVPYLNEEVVQRALDVGMMMLDPNWKRGDAPYKLGGRRLKKDKQGRIRVERIVQGKLSWYQPRNCCHWIAVFSMAIGVLNYPELNWRFISGDRHTVPVGYDAEGKPRVVMDILLFDQNSAEASIALAREDFPKMRASSQMHQAWVLLLRTFVEVTVPGLKLTACKRMEKTKGKGDHRIERILAQLRDEMEDLDARKSDLLSR